MSKIDEVKVAIGETIKPNNKKAINAQTLANILNAMVDVMPESGGGLKYSEERMLYPSDNEGFNEEQRAYNIETYNKVMNGEAITVNMGGAILAISPTGIIDEQGNEIVETTTVTISKLTIWIQLFSDGSTLSQVGTTSGSNILIYGDQESFKQFFAKPTFYLEDVTLFVLVAAYKVTAIIMPIEGLTDNRVTMSCVGLDMAMDLVFNTDTGEVIEEHSYTIKAPAKAYINVTDTESEYAMYNRDAVADASLHDTYFAKDALSESDTEKYMVLSVSYSSDYATITIYRNDKFEKWQINRTDGTSSLVTQ